MRRWKRPSRMAKFELTNPAQSATYYIDFDEQSERLVIPMRKSWKVIGGADTGLIALLVKFAIGYQKMDD